MKNTLAPGVPLAIVLAAAVATVVLWAAARRQEPRWLPGTEPEPVTVTAGESRPRPAMIAGTHDGIGRELPGPQGSPGRCGALAQAAPHAAAQRVRVPGAAGVIREDAGQGVRPNGGRGRSRRSPRPVPGGGGPAGR
jgi:hypothetical protein